MSFAEAARLAGRITGAAGLAAALAALAACDRVGSPFEALGGRVPPPDEFQVIQYAPPVVPESYTLPEPQPGAPSPRAPNPDREAVAALLGPEAAQAAAAEPSPGERVLLGSADAASTSGEIRVQLERDQRRAAADEEYEPPTIWQLLGFASDEEEIDETQVIDPVTEAERLQAQGVPAPVDPEAAARAAEEAEPEEEVEPIDRRPTNRIGPPPEPAFQ